jgi:hypothetical protein
MAISGGISGADSVDLFVDDFFIEKESNVFIADPHSISTESIREMEGGFECSCLRKSSISLRFPSTTI